MIHQGDLCSVLPTLEADLVDACITDPPYELGFMGKAWDGTGIAYRPAMWAAVLRVLKPGAYLVAFGGTRTSHRMVCAIEDAGFEIRDTLCWLYGSGFPKSLDVSKAIDKAAGVSREVLGVNRYAVKRTGHDKEGVLSSRGPGLGGLASAEMTAPSTDAAKQWDGWGTALKPAYEPIVLARKPFKGSVADNVLQHGTGGLNIDGCRIAGDVPVTTQGASSRIYGGGRGFAPTGRQPNNPNNFGRWPANVVLDDEAAAMLDEQSGERASGGTPKVRTADKFRNTYGAFKGAAVEDGIGGSIGGASRFFYTAKPSREERELGIYDGRNGHPTVKPLALMRWLVRLVTPPDGIVLDPFLGSGTTAMACRAEGRRFIGIEREAEYVEIAKRRINSIAPLFGDSTEGEAIR